jgi:hypothetical protein
MSRNRRSTRITAVAAFVLALSAAGGTTAFAVAEPSAPATSSAVATTDVKPAVWFPATIGDEPGVAQPTVWFPSAIDAQPTVWFPNSIQA